MNARNETSVPTMRCAQAGDLAAIVALLDEAGLPTGDLAAGLPGRFLVVVGDQGGANAPAPVVMAGVVGLEINGHAGLLRSLAVQTRWRGRGLAAQLVDHCEADARSAGVSELYLLTSSAADYFRQRGYSLVARDAVPATIAEHAQFRSLCPASAQCLHKTLG